MLELDLGYQVIEGVKPVLIVAGHNFPHGRIGKIKFGEYGTGDIARKLCEKYGYFGIISTKVQMDPNWYNTSPFREKVLQIVKSKQIKLVIDLHGSGMQNEELIFLRTNKIFQNSYPQIKNFRNFLNNEQLTLPEELENKIAAVEIEIRQDGRVDTIDPSAYNLAQKQIEELIKLMHE